MSNSGLITKVSKGFIIVPLLIGILSFANRQIRYKIFDLFGNINIKTNRNIIDVSSDTCKPLSEDITKILSTDIDKWSVSVLTRSGIKVFELNSNIPRVPASNQKLFTTAFALDKLGPNFILKTRIFSNYRGKLILVGSGDPDLNPISLRKLIGNNLNYNPNLFNRNNNIKEFLVFEEPFSNWWPNSWHSSDKKQSYGAPITRLAINSNATIVAVNDPVERLKNLINSEANSKGIRSSIYFQTHSNSDLFIIPKRLVGLVESVPMSGLLSLANSESHNFTSEVLLRHAANSWNTDIATTRLSNWLRKNRLQTSGFLISDGSGLSRSNRLTSHGIAKLLIFMLEHKYSNRYISSLSIAGVRGTLSEKYLDSPLYASFYGKTGTLTGVRSLSGYLETTDGLRIISILANGSDFPPEEIINNILNIIAINSPCKT